MDVSYFSINDILEYNLPHMQSDFTCNMGPTIFYAVGNIGKYISFF